ncbi:MAG: DUF1338 domain-containing protein [Burkholderiales bacterium]|nr:DUF1338 domain-containing protein [Burkholderiales bacterium]
MEAKLVKLKQLLANLWSQYVKESPDSLNIYNLFCEHEENVVNDHIALRTFDDPRINVKKLGGFFEELGYQECGEYHFNSKKLYAKHYEHKDDEAQPKIFISELLTNEFSPFLQATVKSLVDAIPVDKLSSSDLLFAGTLWGELDYDIYQKLLNESEYAAWLYVFGFRANHFTVFVNKMQKFSSIEQINQFIKQHNYNLNTSGGEIKGGRNELLEQSSTRANKVAVKFKQGTFEVLNSYYEFAKRYPMRDGKLYQGFVAASADKIFESTDVKSEVSV